MKLVRLRVTIGNTGPGCTLISEPVIGQKHLYKYSAQCTVAQVFEPESLSKGLRIAVHIVLFYG